MNSLHACFRNEMMKTVAGVQCSHALQNCAYIVWTRSCRNTVENEPSDHHSAHIPTRTIGADDCVEIFKYPRDQHFIKARTNSSESECSMNFPFCQLLSITGRLLLIFFETSSSSMWMPFAGVSLYTHIRNGNSERDREIHMYIIVFRHRHHRYFFIIFFGTEISDCFIWWCPVFSFLFVRLPPQFWWLRGWMAATALKMKWTKRMDERTDGRMDERTNRVTNGLFRV